MIKMLRCNLVLVVSLSIFCIVPSSIATEGGPKRLVSPEQLKETELEILWENKLPIKTGENLGRLFILGNRIYGLSDENFIVSLNRKNGKVIFSRPLAETGFPVVGLGLCENVLYAVAGNKLIEINPDSGEKIKGKRLRFIAACPAASNESHYYIAGTDRRMHVLRSKDKVKVFEVAAESDSIITSVVANENSVIFATVAGDVISVMPDKTEKLWDFNAADSIARPIVMDGNSLFAASKDTNIYRLNVKTGKLVWKYQTGAILNKGPSVTESIVYQYARDEGLSAIDKESGKLMWQLKNGVDLLAEAGGKSYVITNSGKLLIMDNKKALQLSSVDLPGVSRYATNVTDSKIYVADKNGRIACLNPIR